MVGAFWLDDLFREVISLVRCLPQQLLQVPFVKQEAQLKGRVIFFQIGSGRTDFL